MKKTYINPEISDVLMGMEAILAGSPDGFNNDLDDNNPVDPDNILSRRRTVWDDEESFDEEEF